MNKDFLKKALIIGIPAGIVSAFAVILIRTLSAGGTYLSHLTSDFGILVFILLPISWVFHLYRREKEKFEAKAREEEKEA
ncbi:MAG: hypothetical protein J5496_01645 [Lachnospiraceae bacterium]|nr:hypothetical protein [Lachnospiraceae bacterium]